MKFGDGLHRFRAALDRHGPAAFCKIIWDVVRRIGPAGAARLIDQDQPFTSVARADNAERTPVWPPRLDGGGMISADLWRRWAKSWTTARVASDPSIAFVLPGDGDDPAQHAAVTAAAPGAAIVTTATLEPDPAWIYVFLEPGDVPQPALASTVRGAFLGATQVVTFDHFFSRGEAIGLSLAPGANLPRLLEDEALYRRGAVSGAFLAAATTGASLRDRIAGWASALTPDELRRAWVHLGEPLVQAPPPESHLSRLPTPSGLAPSSLGGVSAIICTRDKGRLTRQLVRQLLSLPPAQVAEVIILSNGTTDPYALQTLVDLAADPRVMVQRQDQPFNFSKLCNAGVALSRSAGPLLFLNDDIAPINDDWLDCLLARLGVVGTGAVGPLLLYPDERVQHAGMYLRLPGGAGHVLRGARLPEDDPLGLTSTAREVSCLTGAVLLVDRTAFHSVGGFDEELALSFQDADLCLKLYAAGLRNVLEPRAALLHMESVSLGVVAPDEATALQRHRELRLFADRWTHTFPQDPFHSTALDPADESGRRLRRLADRLAV